MTPAFIALMGAVIAAAGAFWAARKQETESTKAAQDRAQFERELREKSDQQAQAQRELREKSDEIAALYRRIAESQEELRKTATEQTEVQRDLRKKSDEIAALNRKIAEAQTELRIKSDEVAELNRSIAASVIGGDSFCYATLIMSENGGRWIVVHQGKYPLYEVQLRIVDLDKADEIEEQSKREGVPITFEMLKLSDTVLTLGNMSPQLSQIPGLFLRFPPNKQRLRFNIFITARNGRFTELLRLRNVNGKWTEAMRVMKENHSDATPNASPTVLLEKIDPDFPRSQDGQVDWLN